MADDDDDGFIPNEDDEWKTDDNEAHDEFPLDAEEDEKAPVFTKKGSGAKTIFVTYQFRHFHDDYCVLGPIGEPGQFGIAYECYLRSDSSQTRRCVKEINKARFHHISSDARNDVLRTMQNEIAILKKIDHPNIVQLYDVYEDRHKLHLIMEYLPGGELFARICEKESFCESEVCTILTQILSALDYMHDMNILHLDLKPDNILFTNKSNTNNTIKLIDFGMARVVPRLAKLKDRVGTPNYMAPEVFSGNYSKAADIWSVGIITFCMLFGFPPFYVDDEDIHLDEHSALEIKIKRGFEPIVKDGFGAWFPSEIEISSDCKYLLSKMFEMDVKKRWTVKECLSSTWIRNINNNSTKTKTIPPIVRDALKKFHSTSKFKVAISNLFTHQIDPDHIREIRKFFNELDINNDGAISLIEFKNGMMNKFNTQLSDQQLEEIFKNVDLDDDRSITFNELMTITAHRMLVDEDERLYQAFQDLDVDGDGLISKQELQFAIDKWEEKNNNENDNNNNKKHKRQNTVMLKRFQSAFQSADKNGDGQIDYEEFLRILHPDFQNDEMTMKDFKSNVTQDGTRVRGAQFNVDYQAADASQYVEIKPSPRPSPDNKKNKNKMEFKPKQIPKTLTLDAFHNHNNNKNKNNNNFEIIQKQKIEIQNLKEKFEIYENKFNELENNNKYLKNKYENEMFNKFKEQTNNVTQLQNKIQISFNEKDKIINEKDILITNLNILLDKRNQIIENLKLKLTNSKTNMQNLEILLQNAIDSKIKSLVQSQNEIQKLKNMIVMSPANTPRLNPNYSNTSSNHSITSPLSINNNNSNSNSNKRRKKKARHLSHLIGD